MPKVSDMPTTEVCHVKAIAVAQLTDASVTEDKEGLAALGVDAIRECIDKGKYYLLSHFPPDEYGHEATWLATSYTPKQLRNYVFVSGETPEETSPPPPVTVDIASSREGLIGGISEVFPDTKIFATNRHVIEGMTPDDLKRSLAKAAVNLDQQRCYLFHRKGTGFPGDSATWHELDIALIVPKNDHTLVFQPAPDAVAEDFRCHAEGGIIENPQRMQLRANQASHVSFNVNLKDKYYAYHYGTKGEDVTSGFSSGVIAEQARSGSFFLPPENPAGSADATPRSSGSIVYTKKPDEVGWKIGGFLECKIPENASGLDKAGEVRVIPFESLLDSVAEPVDCSSPKFLDPRPRSKDCIPIDARGGGGR